MTAAPLAIRCDDCGATSFGQLGDTIDTLRSWLYRELGWSVRDGDGEIDFCDRCVERRWGTPQLTTSTHDAPIELDPILVVRVPRRALLQRATDRGGQ